MRLFDNGRAVHAKVRPSSLRHYEFSEVAVSSARDSVRGKSAVQFGANILPGVVDSPTGKGRKFLTATTSCLVEAAADSESRDAMEGNWTLGALLRLTAYSGAGSHAFGYQGVIGDAATDPQNYMGRIGWTVAGNPECLWEFGGGSNVQSVATDYVIPLYKWVYVVWRKSLATGPGDTGGTCTLELVINGQVIKTFPGITNTSHGSLAVWRIGHEASGAAAANVPNADLAGCYAWSEPLADEEIWADMRRFHLQGFFSRVDIQVDIQGNAGRRIRVTDMAGVDWVDSVELSDELDQACATATITLLREQENLSLALLKTDTKLNLTNVLDPTSYLPFLDVARGVEIFAARVPLGISATDHDLLDASVFRGAIDEADDGAAETITLQCRDDGGVLVDTFIEQEVNYGNVVPIAVEGEMQDILNDNDNTTANDTVIPSVDNPLPATALLLRTGSYPPVTLYTPTSPLWSVTRWRQRREGVLAALRTLSEQTAWEVKYRFDDNPTQNVWRLTFYDPQRGRLDADAVITPDDVLDVQTLKRSLFGIRNVVRVIYASSETISPVYVLSAADLADGYVLRSGWVDIDGEGNRVAAFVEIESTASVALYGRRLFCEFKEGSSSQIDTIGEAVAMALGACKDMDIAQLNKGITLPCMPELELNDMLKFSTNAQLFTAAQRLAVRQITHSIGEQATTTVQLRGKPAIGFKRWLRLDARSGFPGVMRPGDALTDLTAGTLLSTVRNVLDRTGYLKGGKYVALRNPSFDNFSNGKQNFPDDWFPDTTEVWTSGQLFWDPNSVTGGLSLKMFDNGGGAQPRIVSGLVPVNGSPHITYSIQITWMRLVASLDGILVELFYFDKNRVALASTLFEFRHPTPAFPAGDNLAGVWMTERIDGYGVVANTAFVKLRLQKVVHGGVQTDLLVDSVGLYRTANALKQNNPAANQVGVAPAAGSEKWQRVLWNATSVFDYGSQGVAGGKGFLVKERGLYEIRAHVAGDTGAAARVFSIRLTKNATYDATEHFLTAGPGVVLAIGDAPNCKAKGDVGTYPAGVQAQLAFATLVTQENLVEGDVLNIEWFSMGSNVDVVGFTLIPRATYWEVKLKLSE